MRRLTLPPAATLVARRIAMVAACMLAPTACKDLLKVENPGALQEGQLTDPALEQFVVNGALGNLQYGFGQYAWFSGVLSDEVFTDHSDVSYAALSRHSFDGGNAANALVYLSLQRARQAAEEAADRLKTMVGANASSSLNVARALVYAGYANVLLGEGFCEAPVDLNAPLTSRQFRMRAIARFDEGITVATAAKTVANAAAAQDLIYFAQVGAARASIKIGDTAKARTYAQSVPDAYEFWAYYSANSVRENNPLLDPTRTLQPYLGMQPAFRDLSDARVPQSATTRNSQNGNQILAPLKPSMYSGWTGTGPPQAVSAATNIRIASGLEARYIGVEADGPNAAMLAFVNNRRAVGGKPPVNRAGSALLAEFRMQRAIDFYLTGQRLGDLRRYAESGTDLFPTGKLPVLSASYGSMHCFIIPNSER